MPAARSVELYGLFDCDFQWACARLSLSIERLEITGFRCRPSSRVTVSIERETTDDLHGISVNSISIRFPISSRQTTILLISSSSDVAGELRQQFSAV
jgi:hypothetical protein